MFPRKSTHDPDLTGTPLNRWAREVLPQLKEQVFATPQQMAYQAYLSGLQQGYADCANLLLDRSRHLYNLLHEPIPVPDMEVLSKPVETLGLPKRIHTALRKMGATTIADIAARHRSDFYRLRNFGIRSMTQLTDALALHGVILQD